MFQCDVFQSQADFFCNNLSTRQDSDVFQHGLATVTETGSLDCAGFQDTADIVDNQRSQSFTFDVFSDDQQRTAGFGDLFQNRQQIADIGDFLFAKQNVRIVHRDSLFFCIVDEVRRQITTVELHTFDDIQFVIQGFAVFNGNDAFLADFFHSFGDTFTDGVVAVGGNGTDLCDFLAGGARFGDFFQFFDGGFNSLVDAAFQIHWIHTCSNVFHTFANDGLCQNGSGRGTVTCVVTGFGSDFLDHLCAHVHELVFQFDFLGNGNAILGDGRGAPGAFQNNVSAFRAQCDLDGVCQNIDAFNHFVTAAIAEYDFFS